MCIRDRYDTDCEIAGDIDFIFGGGDALFENCVIRTVDNHIPHSYVTAPSGRADGLGFVFWNCDFVSDCPPGSVYPVSYTHLPATQSSSSAVRQRPR